MAVVFCEVASLPASGSERQNAPMISPFARREDIFVFVLQFQILIPQQTSELFTDITTEAEASTLEISSIART